MKVHYPINMLACRCFYGVLMVLSLGCIFLNMVIKIMKSIATLKGQECSSTYKGVLRYQWVQLQLACSYMPVFLIAVLLFLAIGLRRRNTSDKSGNLHSIDSGIFDTEYQLENQARFIKQTNSDVETYNKL